MLKMSTPSRGSFSKRHASSLSAPRPASRRHRSSSIGLGVGLAAGETPQRLVQPTNTPNQRTCHSLCLYGSSKNRRGSAAAFSVKALSHVRRHSRAIQQDELKTFAELSKKLSEQVRVPIYVADVLMY